MLKENFLEIQKMKSNNTKLHYLLRQNSGKDLTKTLIASLSKIFNRDIGCFNVLDLEESDRLRKNFYQAVAGADKDKAKGKIYTWGKVENAKNFLQSLLKSQPNGKGYLFFGNKDEVGGIEICFKEYIYYAFELLKLDGDTVFFISKEEGYNINLTSFEEWPDFKITYEIVLIKGK